MITLTLRHGGFETVVNNVVNSIEMICEETGCRMEWGNSTSETLRWNFFFHNERQGECVNAMLLDLTRDYHNQMVVVYS